MMWITWGQKKAWNSSTGCAEIAPNQKARDAQFLIGNNLNKIKQIEGLSPDQGLPCYYNYL